MYLIFFQKKYKGAHKSTTTSVVEAMLQFWMPGDVVGEQTLPISKSLQWSAWLLGQKYVPKFRARCDCWETDNL